ncbi:CPBP family intramembrane metalloprotease [Mycolicibacillus parakoreensis]|uniref:CPBP family intramembrane metalloprotease n=1 Tax=Mycolicibacillus parakoreensis TaxID=1069221 RepID=A0ABY3U7A9_9MYCO|nr:CPBP family intramembrane glutamic endopeptidase [Mycolicibacillus parakoreensis]MCV7314348.1 CPBP family intramembrane metalloprotease [Mycolicibacillus parakoreensis]ULN53304.1 CPBP family intramembrane metalloprotease [Mycolicibacillus parakoreensis]HLS00045.1 CPBP family intramembrane glutamic endopeptidase [Mycolicibacillus parakoreensis]
MRALGLAAGLLGWSALGPRLPHRWRTPVQAAAGTAMALAGRARLGLGPPAVWPGLRWGVPAAAGAAAAVAATTALPAVRLAMGARELPPIVPWLSWQIPVGTVWAEESAYRGALGSAAAAAFGPARGRLLQAATFGLSHIADARRAGDPVLPTVVATGAAGWLLGWLADRTGSLSAPLLAHLGINESGALAALSVQRRAGR